MLRRRANAEDKGKLFCNSPAESKAASSQCHCGGTGTLLADAKALPDVLVWFKHHGYQNERLSSSIAEMTSFFLNMYDTGVQIVTRCSWASMDEKEQRPLKQKITSKLLWRI